VDALIGADRSTCRTILKLSYYYIDIHNVWLCARKLSELVVVSAFIGEAARSFHRLAASRKLTLSSYKTVYAVYISVISRFNLSAAESIFIGAAVYSARSWWRYFVFTVTVVCELSCTTEHRF
jgi:hypothetical protein